MGYSPEQLQVARQALRAARKFGATPREQKALISAGLVESTLQHEKYSQVGSGDRDSVGFLQQRPSQGWGPAGESVATDTRQFLEAARRARGVKGSAGKLAQAVQRSGYPDRYDQRGGDAEAILRRAGGGGGRVPNNARGASVTLGAAGPAGAQQGQEGLLPLLQAMAQEKPQIASAGLSGPAHSAQAPTPAGYQPVQGGGGPQPKPDISPLLAAIQTQGALPQAPASPDVTVTPGQRGGGGGEQALGGRPAGRGQFKITGPNPGRLQAPIRQFAEKVSAIYGKPITGSDGTGHSYRTVSGNVSDHSAGNATDVPLGGRELLRAGRAALIAAGMPRRQAVKAGGGLYNVGGHQIIFATNEGGDHTGHLHISAKKRR